MSPRVLPFPDPAQAVGLDLGLKDLVVPGTGQREPAPRVYRRAARTRCCASRRRKELDAV
jgi:transposase